MNKKHFKPTIGTDKNWYLRVVSSEEGEFGELQEKSGFLKFASEEKANKAFDMLENGEASATVGKQIGTSGLCTVTIAKVEILEEVAPATA